MTRLHEMFALLLLIVGILLGTGCLYQDYNPDHDIILIKVTSTGALEWSKAFDTGKDDLPLSFFQTSDGGYVMLAAIEDKNRYRVFHNDLVKFSDTGDEQWNRTLYQLHCGEEFLIKGPDGFLLTYVSSPELGEICKFNSRGVIVWNGTLVIIGNESMNASEVSNISNTHIESVPPDEKENITRVQTPLPAGHCVPTFDGGFSCAELRNNDDKKSNNSFEGRKTIVIVKKLDANGILLWEQPVTSFCKPVSMSNIELTGFIQTSDGGYVILGDRDNFWKC